MYTHIHTHPYAQTHTDCISAQVRGWPCCSLSLGVPEMEALAFSWRSSLHQHTQLNSAVLETQAPKILLQLSAHLLCVCSFLELGVCVHVHPPTPRPPSPRLLLPAPTNTHSLRWDVGGRAIKKKSRGEGELEEFCHQEFPSPMFIYRTCAGTARVYKIRRAAAPKSGTKQVCGGHTRAPVALTKLPYSIF